MVSEIKLFQCTVPKLLIKNIYYILLLIPTFIAQVTKLVQFTCYNTFSKIPPKTSMHFATRVRIWHVARLYSVQCTVQWNSSTLEAVQNRTHVRNTFLLRITDTMISQNIDIFSWDTLYTHEPWVSLLFTNPCKALTGLEINAKGDCADRLCVEE
jgi:hypothetical protein